MLCLQENKAEALTKEVCFRIWGDYEVQWLDNPTVGYMGGSICGEKGLFKVENPLLGMVLWLEVAFGMRGNLRLRLDASK